MASAFDPYHAWLGIPANEQPPNYYRLLGIPLFESDPDVIQNGRDQRMAYLKSFANGPHVADSQRLLNEVAQAGVCLLRSADKQAYDSRLRQSVAPTSPAGEPRRLVAPPPPAASTGIAANGSPPRIQAATPTANSDYTSRQKDRSRTNRVRRARFVLLAAQVLLGGMAGLAVAFFVLFLVNPNHPLVVSLSRARQPDPVTKVGSEEPGQETSPAPTEPGPSELGPAPESTASEPESGQATTVLVPPDPSPRPAAASVHPQVAERTGPAQVPSTTPASPPFRRPAATPGSTGSPAPASPPPGIAKSVVLDLERSSMSVPLAEVESLRDVEVDIFSVSDLGTPYDLQPSQSGITHKRPVDLVLTDFSGVKIRLSLETQGNANIIKVAPEIEIGQGKSADLTQSAVKRATATWTKQATAANARLAVAQREAQAIQAWLASSAPKALAVRGAKRSQLQRLNSQLIPALQQQAAYAQARANSMQRLAQLTEQMHNKARLDFMVRLPAENATSSPDSSD